MSEEAKSGKNFNLNQRHEGATRKRNNNYGDKKRPNHQNSNASISNSGHTGRLKKTKDKTEDRFNKRNPDSKNIQEVSNDPPESKIEQHETNNKKQENTTNNGGQKKNATDNEKLQELGMAKKEEQDTENLCEEQQVATDINNVKDEIVSQPCPQVEVDESWENNDIVSSSEAAIEYNITVSTPKTSLEQNLSKEKNYKPTPQTTNRCQDNKFKASRHFNDNDHHYTQSTHSMKSRHSDSNYFNSYNASRKDNYPKSTRISDSEVGLNPNAKPFQFEEGPTFQYYERNIWKKKGKKEFKHVTEIEADLFSMGDDYCLANCVAEDMNMGSGIAITFRQKFKQISELLAQKAKQGGLAYLKDKDRFIYYLVTKRESNLKPTLETLFRSLLKLKEHMLTHNMTKLAAPTLGCGLDRLEWTDVKDMLEYVFTGTDVQITICIFQKAEDVMTQSKTDHRSRKCKIVLFDQPITEIEPNTLILYMGTENGHVSPQIEQLEPKFRITRDYKNKERTLGGHLVTYAMNFAYGLYGCIVRKTERDPFNYKYFEKCIIDINKKNQKNEKNGEKYYYVAMQKFEDSSDDMLMSKVINILRNTFYGVEIYITN